MQPWYSIAIPRKEVRDGRSFNPDEFAIALEQVVAGTAPKDYTDPEEFFSRTVFTKALTDHAGMVLRRLSGETTRSAPVLSLITQFGGGKTHTLTALYHLVNNGKKAVKYKGVEKLLSEAGLSSVPQARIAVFVGNAWDPQDGKETPWIDVARQLAGDEGVAILGKAAKKTSPGTEALGKIFEAAGAPVLILFDEVLNFLNRHRDMADAFYAFIQNLTVATTATTRGSAVMSTPRSKTEMTDWDHEWQAKIEKIVRRVAKDLISNDEKEIAEVVRRRLFEDLGDEKITKKVARTFAEWCFNNRAQLPREWTAVDSSTTDAKAREFLQKRFESCYPFHPATISVFQRKWQVLPQFQQTRGTLAMFAQWISIIYVQQLRQRSGEVVITLGSAPLENREFRATVMGQLGEQRLLAAIDTDISGEHSHARALDADTKGPLRGIHRRVGTAIFFESSGGQLGDKAAHLPELRFALGEPEIETTSIDNAAFALESKAFFMKQFGTDGFKISHKATLKKVVNDRRASLDGENEIKPAMRSYVKKEFAKGATLPIVDFPKESADVPDSPRLTLVLMDPSVVWEESDEQREQVLEWTRKRGNSQRLYPAALIWCFRKPGPDFQDQVEWLLAWQRVRREAEEGSLGPDQEADSGDVRTNMRKAEEEVIDEVWASYRYIALLDSGESGGLKVIDFGAGHASSSETLCGRVVSAMKSEGLLSEAPGAGYIERNWPSALKESGTWPLTSLRQNFLNGTFTRLVDPDSALRAKIIEFVAKGDYGLASGLKSDGSFDTVWFEELVSRDDVTFDKDTYLISKKRGRSLKAEPKPGPTKPVESTPALDVSGPGTQPKAGPVGLAPAEPVQLLIEGMIPAEIWNRLGTKLIPKLKSGSDLKVRIEFTVKIDAKQADYAETELKQVLDDLGLTGKVHIERTE